MVKHNRLLLMGAGDASVDGKLESTEWSWWLESSVHEFTEEELAGNKLTKEHGVAFIKELIPHLPEILQQPTLTVDGYHVMRTNPDGQWLLFLFVSECPRPHDAEEIVAKYFPTLYLLA